MVLCRFSALVEFLLVTFRGFASEIIWIKIWSSTTATANGQPFNFLGITYVVFMNDKVQIVVHGPWAEQDNILELQV